MVSNMSPVAICVNLNPEVTMQHQVNMSGTNANIRQSKGNSKAKILAKLFMSARKFNSLNECSRNLRRVIKGYYIIHFREIMSRNIKAASLFTRYDK